ncbi:hypothetical protein AB4501_32285, partial [Vibrio sp. 10N.222.55.E8]
MHMWGISISEKARMQLEQHGFSKVILQYYKANGRDYCYGLDKPVLAINGTMRWSGIDLGEEFGEDIAFGKPVTMSSYY